MKKRDILYDDVIRYLYGLQKYGIKFGLSKTSNLLKFFGNPHHGQRYVHIAGTNGKGSVAAMLEAVLLESGLKVGLYSSPHLVRFTERFRINGQEISPEKVAAIGGELMDVIDSKEPPTFFEVVTAMALIYFAREGTDISIMEVGMGGRLDATNVIRPRVSVITNISLDHQFFLGRHLRDIAKEKAGIIKQGVDLVTGATQPVVIELFRRKCQEKGASFWRVGKDVRYRTNGTRLNYYGLKRRLKDLELGLHGIYQHRNAATALAVVELLGEKEGYKVSSDHIRAGLRKPVWPGRLHIVSREPLLILDGAHNPGAIRSLAHSIQKGFRYRRLILVLGVMGDKDIKGIMRGIVPIADYVIYSRPEYHRAAAPETLERVGAPIGKPGEILPELPQALQRARELASPEDMILVTGSLFAVGDAIAILDPNKNRPDSIRQ